MSAKFIAVASVDDIAENSSKSVLVEGRSVLLCHTREGVFAVENRCSHQFQELEGGKIRGCFVFCPLHGQRFNLKTGEAIGQLTDKPIATFAVRVEDGRIMVAPDLSADAPN